MSPSYHQISNQSGRKSREKSYPFKHNKVAGAVALRLVIMLVKLFFWSAVIYTVFSQNEQNIVSQWNHLLGVAIKNTKLYPPETTRMYAVMHLGIKKAFDMVENDPIDENCADREILTVSIAAHYIIGGILPMARDQADALMRSIMSNVNCDPQATRFYNILAINSAMDTLAERSKDTCNCYYNYVAPDEYWAWLPTNPSQRYPVLPCWGNTTFFAGVSNILRFMPSGPPSPNSAEFVAHWQEVFVMGKKTSTLRSVYLTESAILWDPPIFVNFLNKIIADVLASDPRTARSIRAHVDIFYLANAAGANAAIVTWKTKYIFNFWRPVHSNRVGMTQFPQIPYDPQWDSLLPTPPFPEYTSGHSAIGSGMLVVLRELLGDRHNFVVTDGVYSHAYNSITAAIVANEESRYYGGVHWRFSGEHSAAIGRQMAYEVLKLNPVKGLPWNGAVKEIPV